MNTITFTLITLGLDQALFYIKNRFYVVSKYIELYIYKTELNRARNVFGIWSYMKKYKFLCLHLVFLKKIVINLVG